MLDLFSETLRSLRAHALRFVLTSSGIFWGALLLTFVISFAIGSERAFYQRVDKTGPKTIWAFPGTILKERVGMRGARSLDLEDEDVERIEAIDLIESSSVEVQLWNQLVRSPEHARLLSVVGLDADGIAMRRFEAEEGRLFHRADVESAALVAFLGAEARSLLFGEAPALGKTIRLEGIPLRVVGVAARKGEQLMNMGARDDDLVVVPSTTAVRRFARKERVERFIAMPRSRAEAGLAIEAIRSITGLHHRFEPGDEMAMLFVDVREIYSILDLIFSALRVFLVGVGVITLAVGAVGVMNIMLVVVGERVQEIGLRKAIGATNRAIFLLFLAEAGAVALLSGVAGAVVSYGLVRVLQVVLPKDGGMSPPVFAGEVVVWMVCALVLVGILAGVLPALRAARIAPAESLRAL
ncbi:MAG: ABC transporter permease [Deltaproteobacteria bacterium]|nr:ABC transporter permease [Deltaproteobacteria bacterium]